MSVQALPTELIGKFPLATSNRSTLYQHGYIQKEDLKSYPTLTIGETVGVSVVCYLSLIVD